MELPIIPTIVQRNGRLLVVHGKREYGSFKTAEWERAARRARHVTNSSNPRRERKKN